MTGTPTSSAPRRVSLAGARGSSFEIAIVFELSKPEPESGPKRSRSPPGLTWTWRRRPAGVSSVASMRSGATRRFVMPPPAPPISFSAAARLAGRTSDSPSRPFGAFCGCSSLGRVMIDVSGVSMSTEPMKLTSPATIAPPTTIRIANATRQPLAAPERLTRRVGTCVWEDAVQCEAPAAACRASSACSACASAASAAVSSRATSTCSAASHVASSRSVRSCQTDSVGRLRARAQPLERVLADLAPERVVLGHLERRA